MLSIMKLSSENLDVKNLTIHNGRGVNKREREREREEERSLDEGAFPSPAFHQIHTVYNYRYAIVY